MFRGKRVVITGGSSGLGLALAERLADRGARLILIGRDPHKLDRARAHLTPRLAPEAELSTHSLDVAEERAVADTFEVIADEAPVDLLVNSAGIAQEGPFLEQPSRTFRELMDVNFFGTLHCIRAVTPSFVQRRRGWIVNISSMAGLSTAYGYTAYCASKHAVMGLSGALRQELKPRGVTVQVVCPGEFDSPMVDALNVGRSPQNRAVVNTLPVMTLPAVADEVLAGMQRGTYCIVPGVSWRAFERINRLAPGISRAVADWRMSRVDP